jgi:hypothetical protein
MADGEAVVGPLFISIGDQEKLNAFLEQNPKVPRDQIFVDDYSFDAYKSAGFGRFDEQDKDVSKEAMKNMGAPDLGFKGWLSYLGSAAKVSPIPKDMKFGEVPEGVLRLGGTFVVKGNDILYRWSDRLPGDHPDIRNVVGIAKEAQAQKSGVSGIFANLFNA